jgi:hypothetical protein
LPAAGRFFCDASGRAEVASFFRERVTAGSDGERSLNTVLETIELCGPRRAAHRRGAEAFLRGYTGVSSAAGTPSQ